MSLGNIIGRLGFWLKYSIPGLLCLRKINTSISQKEAELIRKYALGRKVLVEIGVFEGFSALHERVSMAEDATLFLIDPFASGIIPGLNVQEVLARRHVARSKNGKAVFIKDYSFNVAKNWSQSIDYLFIDADHSEEAFERDFNDWIRFLSYDGVAIFHDAKPDSGSQVGLVLNRLIRYNPNTIWQIIDECDKMLVIKRKIHI